MERLAEARLSALDTDVEERQRDERFEAFVAQHRERAVRLAWRLVDGDAGAAEDVAQEAFVRAYRALPQFRGDSSLSTWYYRILLREASRYRRWRAVRQRFAGDSSGDGPDPNPTPQGDPGLRRRIAAALGKLTRPQREAFVLVHMEEFTVAQAAELMGKATGTVKSHLHRALRGLRKDLSDLRETKQDAGEAT